MQTFWWNVSANQLTLLKVLTSVSKSIINIGQYTSDNDTTSYVTDSNINASLRAGMKLNNSLSHNIYQLKSTVGLSLIRCLHAFKDKKTYITKL